MKIEIGAVYKAVIQEEKFNLKNDDLVIVIGITDYGVRFVKHKNHSGSPFCWSTNLFKQDFIEFRTIEQTVSAIKSLFAALGEVLTKTFENVPSSSSKRSARTNRAERRRKKSK